MWAVWQAEGFPNSEIIKVNVDSTGALAECETRRIVVDQSLEQLLAGGESRINELNDLKDSWNVWSEGNSSSWRYGWILNKYSCSATDLRFEMTREHRGLAFDSEPGLKIGVAWILRPSGGKY